MNIQTKDEQSNSIDNYSKLMRNILNSNKNYTSYKSNLELKNLNSIKNLLPMKDEMETKMKYKLYKKYKPLKRNKNTKRIRMNTKYIMFKKMKTTRLKKIVKFSINCQTKLKQTNFKTVKSIDKYEIDRHESIILVHRSMNLVNGCNLDKLNKMLVNTSLINQVGNYKKNYIVFGKNIKVPMSIKFDFSNEWNFNEVNNNKLSKYKVMQCNVMNKKCTRKQCTLRKNVKSENNIISTQCDADRRLNGKFDTCVLYNEKNNSKSYKRDKKEVFKKLYKSQESDYINIASYISLTKFHSVINNCLLIDILVNLNETRAEKLVCSIYKSIKRIDSVLYKNKLHKNRVCKFFQNLKKHKSKHKLKSLITHRYFLKKVLIQVYKIIDNYQVLQSSQYSMGQNWSNIEQKIELFNVEKQFNSYQNTTKKFNSWPNSWVEPRNTNTLNVTNLNSRALSVDYDCLCKNTQCECLLNDENMPNPAKLDTLATTISPASKDYQVYINCSNDLDNLKHISEISTDHIKSFSCEKDYNYSNLSCLESQTFDNYFENFNTNFSTIDSDITEKSCIKRPSSSNSFSSRIRQSFDKYDLKTLISGAKKEIKRKISNIVNYTPIKNKKEYSSQMNVMNVISRKCELVSKTMDKVNIKKKEKSLFKNKNRKLYDRGQNHLSGSDIFINNSGNTNRNDSITKSQNVYKIEKCKTSKSTIFRHFSHKSKKHENSLNDSNSTLIHVDSGFDSTSNSRLNLHQSNVDLNYDTNSNSNSKYKLNLHAKNKEINSFPVGEFKIQNSLMSQNLENSHNLQNSTFSLTSEFVNLDNPNIYCSSCNLKHQEFHFNGRYYSTVGNCNNLIYQSNNSMNQNVNPKSLTKKRSFFDKIFKRKKIDLYDNSHIMYTSAYNLQYPNEKVDKDLNINVNVFKNDKIVLKTLQEEPVYYNQFKVQPSLESEYSTCYQQFQSANYTNMNFVNEKKIISTAPPLPPRKKSFSRKEKMPLPKKIVKLEKCDKHIANYIGKVGKMNSFSEKKESKIMKLFRMKRSCFKNEQPTSVYKFRPLPQIPQDENESKSKLSPNASFTEGGTLKPENYAEQLRIAAKLQQQTGLLKIGNTCVNPELSMLPEENYSILPNSILLNSHKSNLKNEYNLKSQSVENWGSIYADSFCSEPPPSINLKKCKSKLYSKYKSSRLCSTPKFPTPVLYCKQNSLVIANNFKQTITNQNVESTDNQCRTNGDYTETNKSIINNKYMDFVSNLKSNYKSDKISKSKSHVSISLDLEKTVVTKIAKYTSDLNLNYTKNVQSIYDKMIFRSLSKPPALPPETNRSSVKSFVSAFENLSNTNLNESTLDKPNITPLRNSSIKFKPVEKENSLKNRHLSLLESTIVHFKTDSDEKPRNSTADMISNLTTKKVKFYPEPKKTKEMIQSVESGINSVISSSSFDKSIVDDLKHLQLNDTHEHSFIIDPANTCPVNNKICFNHEIQFNLPQNIFQFIFENCQNYTFNFGELLTCLVNLDENPNHELLDKLSVFKEWNFIKNFREDLLKSAISIKKPEPSEINQNEIEKLEKLVESLREKQKEIVQKKETVKKSIKNQYFTIKTICEDNGERFTTYFQSISQNIKLMATLVNKICKLMYSCNSLLFTSQAFLFDNFETEILEKFDQLLLELTDSLQLKFDFDWNFTQYMEKFSSKLAPLEKKKIKQLIEINLIISIQENHYKNYTNWVQEIINVG